jgi:hypothetical protein
MWLVIHSHTIHSQVSVKKKYMFKIIQNSCKNKGTISKNKPTENKIFDHFQFVSQNL